MLNLEAGTILTFDHIVSAAIHQSQDLPQSDERCVQGATKKQRLSTENLRLSFGDSVIATPQPAHSTLRPRLSFDNAADSLDKFDRLLISTLFCFPQLKETNHNWNFDLIGDNLFEREEAREAPRYLIRSSVGPKAILDEFLVIEKNVTVHGYGLDSKYRNIIKVHSTTNSVVDAAWCTFRHHTRQVRPEHATITPVLEPFAPVDAICVVEHKKIHVHSDSGESYTQSSSFPIRRIWGYPLGLLLERDCQAVSNLFNVDGYPNIFAMSTHLEEPSPVLFLGDEKGKSSEYFAQLLRPDCVIAGVGDELPIVLIFDHARNIHSLWLGRFTIAEEMDQATDVLKNRVDQGERLHFHGVGDSPLQHSRSKSQSRRFLNSLDSFKLPLPTSSGVKSPVSGISWRKPSLHREVLLATSSKFNQPELSPIQTPLVTDLRRNNFSNTGQLGLNETPQITPENVNVSATIFSDMSISTLSTSKLQSFALASFGQSQEIPLAKRLCHSSPNVSANALKNLRSASSSFIPSKAHSLASGFTESGTSGHTKRISRSGSTQYSKRLIRAHPSQTAPLSADELAYPKIALVHIWNDSLKVSRAGENAFLLNDYMKRHYFCYVLPTENVLRCLSLKISTLDGECISVSSSNVSNIPAVSAAKIPFNNLLVILGPDSSLKLYASPECLLIDLKYSSTIPDCFRCLVPPFNENNLLGPSSLTTSSPHVTQFRLVDSPHFSPVQNLSPASTTNGKSGRPVLVSCAGNQFILDTSTAAQLFSLPQRPSSDLIEKCLVCLRDCVDAAVFKEIYKLVWKSSFPDRKTRLSLEKRWEIFFDAVFSVLGYKLTSSAAENSENAFTLYRKKAAVFGLHKLNNFELSLDELVDSCPQQTLYCVDESLALRYSEAILLMLHLIVEESRLFEIWSEERKCMLPWMHALATVCRSVAWASNYDLQIQNSGIKKKIKITLGSMQEARSKLPTEVPDLMHTLKELIHGRKSPFLIVKSVNPLSKKMILLASAFGSAEKNSLKNGTILNLLEKFGIQSGDFEHLPSSLKVAFQTAFGRLCESVSFGQLPKTVCEISKRHDAEMCKRIADGQQIRDLRMMSSASSGKLDRESNQKRGRFYLSHDMVTKRFTSDARIREAERLLNSWEPVIVPLSMQSDNEVLFLKSQEAWLKSTAPRTMSLPVGRGMLCLRSEYAYATEKLTAPPMVYDGIERSSVRSIRKVLSLKTEDHPNGYDFWPRFHNGVATGLRLRHFGHDKIKFDHHWLAFNACQMTKRESVDYAGIFLGMALNGLIDSNTDPMELHNLLIRLEDSVSIAVLIGMACIKRGTQDKRYYRMIGLHIVSFMPDSGVELIIPQNIHVASLLSLGLLYRSSGNRFVSERLLNEISAVNLSDGESNQAGVPEREAASLSAAFGLGFVLLGLGNENFLGLADLEIPERLRTLMVGGYLSRCRIKKSKEDDSLINTHVTSPGATLALAMIYMKTEREDIAEWMSMPQTLEELDQIRPDFLILRVVAKSLIRWNGVEATEKWVNSNFPKWILKNVFLHARDLERDGVDVISLTQAYFFILAGCAMSLGLKFAGTATAAAQNILMTMAMMMMKWAEDSSLTERCSQSLMQMCLTTILIALANVMAGTGNLAVFRLLRYMHGRTSAPRPFTTYGHQMGVHMAVGLLFLGCGMYTVGTSNEALAAMLVSFFPIWPRNASDNRYHLQAFRHLYILAVENRFLLTKSTQDGQPVQTTVRVTRIDQSLENLITPCVLPELSRLEKVEIASGKYILTFTGERNWEDLRKLLVGGGVYVFPSLANSERGSALDRKPSSLLSHFERNLYWPSSNEKQLVQSMRNFQKHCRIYCCDRNYASLFELASKIWFNEPLANQWILWVIFECSLFGDLDAFTRILAFSKETDEQLRSIAESFLKATDPMEKRNKWKSWMEKAEFVTKVPGSLLSKGRVASSSVQMDANFDVVSSSNLHIKTIVIDFKN